jgi:hypothetical protein
MRRASVLLSAAGVAFGLLLFRVLAEILPPHPAAIGFGAACLLPAAAVLAAMTLLQIATRFATGAFDPTLGRDGRLLVVNQRAITNTVEQLACFAPSLLALSAAAASPPLLALGLTFATARLAFWVGYLIAPILRAPGMAATGAVNLATFAWAAWAWLG